MAGEVEKLQELVDNYDNIVFLVEQEFPQRAGFRISEVRTGCIIRSMITRRRQF